MGRCRGGFGVAAAAGCAVTGHDCDGNHGTAAEKVEEYAEESKDFLSAKEASQQDGENCVQDNSTRKTSDGLLPSGNVGIAISFYSEKVAVDSQNNRRAAELERIQRCRAKLECSTAKAHGRKH